MSSRLVTLLFLVSIAAAFYVADLGPRATSARQSGGEEESESPEEILARGNGLILLGGKILYPPYTFEIVSERLYVNDQLIGPNEWIEETPSEQPPDSIVSLVTNAFLEYSAACKAGTVEELEGHCDALLEALEALPGTVVTLEESNNLVRVDIASEDYPLHCRLITPEQLVVIQENLQDLLPYETPAYREAQLAATQDMLQQTLDVGGLAILPVGTIGNGAFCGPEEARRLIREIRATLERTSDVEDRVKRLRWAGIGLDNARDLANNLSF